MCRHRDRAGDDPSCCRVSKKVLLLAADHAPSFREHAATPILQIDLKFMTVV
jgi:hypothetical protein